MPQQASFDHTDSSQLTLGCVSVKSVDRVLGLLVCLVRDKSFSGRPTGAIKLTCQSNKERHGDKRELDRNCKNIVRVSKCLLYGITDKLTS